MTREEITKTYRVDDRGIIRNPGKFEGEVVYAPHFWDLVLAGRDDSTETDEETGYRVSDVGITKEDREEFPELGTKATGVRLFEDDQGFVHAELSY